MIANQKQIENAFFSDGYRFGLKVADSDNNQKILFETLSEMHNEIDDFNEAVTKLSERQNQPIDCKKGCEWCCHQPVFALNFELDYLNFFVKRNFSPAIQTEIRKRAENKNEKLSLLNENDLLNAKSPCPLLEKGSCIAYQARPMACRIYLSTNVNTCLNFFHKPKDKTSIPSLLNLTLRAGQMMNEGFKAALKTKGILTHEFRIEEKLLEDI